MSKIIFDIETTGLSQQDSSPIQFSFLEVTDGGLPMRRGSMYIKPHKPNWTTGAENVHHISQDFLEKHGVEPEYAAANIWALLQQSDVITYNGKSFDMPLLRCFCDAVGAPTLIERGHLDLYQEFHKVSPYKRQSLRKTIEDIGKSDMLIDRMTQLLFGDDGRNRPHDARFDVVETYYVYKEYLKGVEERVQAVQNSDGAQYTQTELVTDHA